jgi:hypothetical protein
MHCNVSTPYGLRWRCGDIVGCWLDTGSSTSGDGAVHMGFTLNGVDLGDPLHGGDSTAPHGGDSGSGGSGSGGRLLRVLKPSGGGLFPCVSFARDEQVETNFGQKPFVYRVPPRVLQRGGRWRSFRAVAALIQSPLAVDSFWQLRATPAVSMSGRTAASASSSTSGDTAAAIAAASSIDARRERLMDSLMLLGLPVEWAVKALEDRSVMEVRRPPVASTATLSFDTRHCTVVAHCFCLCVV